MFFFLLVVLSPFILHLCEIVLHHHIHTAAVFILVLVIFFTLNKTAIKMDKRRKECFLSLFFLPPPQIFLWGKLVLLHFSLYVIVYYVIHIPCHQYVHIFFLQKKTAIQKRFPFIFLAVTDLLCDFGKLLKINHSTACHPGFALLHAHK